MDRAVKSDNAAQNGTVFVLQEVASDAPRQRGNKAWILPVGSRDCVTKPLKASAEHVEPVVGTQISQELCNASDV